MEGTKEVTQDLLYFVREKSCSAIARYTKCHSPGTRDVVFLPKKQVIITHDSQTSEQTTMPWFKKKIVGKGEYSTTILSEN